MKKSGQITLEIVVMLLLVINIFAFVSVRSWEVSRAATRTVGTSALAMKAVDNIVQKSNLVGISGEGSRGFLEFEMRKDFEGFGCSGSNLALDFLIHNSTDIYDDEGMGLRALVGELEGEGYNRSSDFQLSCSGFDSLPADDHTACACFENLGDTINITTFKKPPAGCECARGPSPALPGPSCGDPGYTGGECNYDVAGEDTCPSGEACQPDCTCAPTATGTCYTAVGGGTCTVDPSTVGEIGTVPMPYYNIDDYPGEHVCECINRAMDAPGCTEVELQGDAIDVFASCVYPMASGKTLNCGGNEIRFAPSSYGFGVEFGDGVTGATLQDCVISGFQEGVHVESDATGNTIEDNDVASAANYDGIRILGDANEVSQNYIHGSQRGLVVEGDDNILSSNTILNSRGTAAGSERGTGLFIDSHASGGQISNNQICDSYKRDILNEFGGGTYTGDDNTCDPAKTDDWKDDCLPAGESGCRYDCSDADRCSCYTESSGTCIVDPNSMGAGETDSCDCINDALSASECQTVELAGDIENYASGCVQMSSDKTLDCKNHNIDGDGVGLESGIQLFGDTNAEVLNCVVTDFNFGIYVGSNADNNKIHDNEVSNNDRYGILLEDCNGNEVYLNTLTTNDRNMVLVGYDDDETYINNVSSNVFCDAVEEDIHQDGSGVQGYGDDNTCDSWDNGWKDDSLPSTMEGCRYACDGTDRLPPP